MLFSWIQRKSVIEGVTSFFGLWFMAYYRLPKGVVRRVERTKPGWRRGGNVRSAHLRHSLGTFWIRADQS
jgi:hypothetical protein